VIWRSFPFFAWWYCYARVFCNRASKSQQSFPRRSFYDEALIAS